METQNHTTANTISIPREKFLTMISQFNIEMYTWNTLNPQPIPPESVYYTRMAFQELERMLASQENADVISKINGSESQNIFNSNLSRFINNACGNHPYLINAKKRKNPYDEPPPRPEWQKELPATILLSIGAMMEKLSENHENLPVQQKLKKAGETVIQAALARL